MKTDREFLDGVYAKAEKLRTEEHPAPKFVFTGKEGRKRTVWSTAAAAVACIALLLTGGLVYRESQPKMEIPEGYTNLLENIPMTLGIEGRAITVEPPLTDAELIAAGNVTGIAKSVYEEEKQSIITMVTVNLTERYKGEPVTSPINVAVTGGVNEADKTYLDYEAVFRRGENVLLFLTKQEDGSYTLFGGAQGKLSRLKGKGREATYAYAGGEQVVLADLLAGLPEIAGE